MGEWNFTELRELCRQQGIPDSKVYRNSLEWRWKRADFHAEKAKEVWTGLFRAPFSTSDQQFYETVFSFEAHTESCIQCLHSMVDMLAQIINVVILRGHLAENEVSAKKLVTKQKNKIPPEILKRLDEFLSCYEFKYVDAFCNTIKHRRLIHSMLKAEYGEGYRNESGIIFYQFRYRHVTYQDTWANDILQKYREAFYKHITCVGVGINEFLKNRTEIK